MLGKYVRAKRLDLRPKATQGDLARAMGKSQRWWSDIETGAATPSEGDLFQIQLLVHGHLEYMRFLAGYREDNPLPHAAEPASDQVREEMLSILDSLPQVGRDARTITGAGNGKRP